MMDFLFLDWLGKPLWMWLAFFAIVLTLLALDLGVLHRKQREIGVRESLSLSLSYIFLGLAFGVVWGVLGYAMTGGRRDFTSITQVVATRYEVLLRVDYALIPVGYPTGKWGEAQRRPVEEVTYWDTWRETRTR